MHTNIEFIFNLNQFSYWFLIDQKVANSNQNFRYEIVSVLFIWINGFFDIRPHVQAKLLINSE